MHPPRTRALLAALLLAVGAALPARAQQEPAPADSAARPRSGRLFWTASGAALAGAFLVDGRVDAMIPHKGGEGYVRFLDAIDHLGRPQALVPLTGAAWLAGKALRSRDLSASATHVLAALAAGGLANATLKYVVGRQRPSVDDDPWVFRPFNPNNAWQSFPSGHVVVGFSFAEAVAAESGQGWVRVLAYGAASSLAWSRVYEDKHWTSDVVAGWLLGVAVVAVTTAAFESRRARAGRRPVRVTEEGVEPAIARRE